MNKVRRITPYFMIAPALILVALTFIFGFIHSLRMVTDCSEEVHCGLTLFAQLLSDSWVLSSIWFSLKVSFMSAGIGSLFGLFLAILLFKTAQNDHAQSSILRINKESYLHLWYKIPILMPYIFVVSIVIDVFSSTGLLANILFKMHWITTNTEFPMLLYDAQGIGIILAYVYKSTPFMAMTLYAILGTVDPVQIQIAQNLGAGRFALFRYIILPKICGQLMASYLIIFAFVFGSYEIPYLLGNSKIQALPVLSYNEYIKIGLDHKLNATALNILMTLWGFFMLGIYLLCERKSK